MEAFRHKYDFDVGVSWLRNFAAYGDSSLEQNRRSQSVDYWKRLVAMGLLECIESEKGPRHDIYRITEKGRTFIGQT